MPITALDIIVDRKAPVTTKMEQRLLDALAVMQQHDFSQLPIIDDDDRQVGIITAERILRTQRNLGAPLDTLFVQHAATNAATVAPDDRLFDVFDLFAKYPAVLVVDSQQKLMGIITPWDAAYHLQERAEDLMLIEDIEKAVKEHILASFTDRQNGQLQQEFLDQAIINMVDRRATNKKNLFNALNKYLNKVKIQHAPLADQVYESFSDFVGQAPKKKGFDDLTLGQYIDLLLNDERWANYGKTFRLEATYIRKLLNDVREIRNKLAHFREDITTEEREVLRYCRDLFDRHPVPVFTLSEADKANLVAKNDNLETDLQPTDDELKPGESRYAQLALYLQSRSASDERIELTFEQIEGILNGPLPASAREHRSWWANDSVGHVQSQQWLDAGWRVARINLTEGRITFARAEERRQQYIRFFSAAINELQRLNAFQMRAASPAGVSWITIAELPRDGIRHPLSLGLSFSRGKRFRVELYIDTGDAGKNKHIFEILYSQRDAIERDLGQPLAWEKLESKRGSRIALYSDGHIDQSEDRLVMLQEWAVAQIIQLERAIADRAEAAAAEVE
jgi:CBS domain-containing protein